MTVGAIVQARMSSRRLPGKVLRPLGGRPLLDHLIDRLERRAGMPVLLATSRDPSDDPVAGYARARGLDLFRGALDDVVGRFREAASSKGWDAFARVCGDSPFLDPALVARGAALYRAGDADVVTNVHPRSFPKGQSVEIVRVEALRRVDAAATDADDREHLTRFFYRHPDRFRILNFSNDEDRSGESLCVDTPEDWDRAERLLRRAGTAAADADWRAWSNWLREESRSGGRP